MQPWTPAGRGIECMARRCADQLPGAPFLHYLRQRFCTNLAEFALSLSSDSSQFLWWRHTIRRHMPSQTTRRTLARQWELLKCLPSAGSGKSALALCAELAGHGFTVSKRQVERDLKDLAEIFPLDRHGDGVPVGWRWMAGANPSSAGPGCGRSALLAPGAGGHRTAAARALAAHHGSALPAGSEQAGQPGGWQRAVPLAGQGPQPARAVDLAGAGRG